MRGGLTKGQGQGGCVQSPGGCTGGKPHGPCLFSGEMLLVLPSSASPCSRWARICRFKGGQAPQVGLGLGRHTCPGAAVLRAGPQHLSFPHTPSCSLPSTQVAATCSAEGSEVKGRNDLELPPLHHPTVGVCPPALRLSWAWAASGLEVRVTSLSTPRGWGAAPSGNPIHIPPEQLGLRRPLRCNLISLTARSCRSCWRAVLV